MEFLEVKLASSDLHEFSDFRLLVLNIIGLHVVDLQPSNLSVEVG